MNIQKLFEAVDADEMNSPLPSIVCELEQQGYAVKIEGLEVTAADMDDKLFDDFEKATNEFNVEVNKENATQKFKLVFTEYHKFNFKTC
jgi:hypothetical protein